LGEVCGGVMHLQYPNTRSMQGKCRENTEMSD
jgi:hypothetical protein